jgi:sterol desaturase/sphingolipid hydroxylase (fatty acid hydroxylase superfamily)
MSRAVLYKRSEETKRRYSFYGLLTAIFYLTTLLVGAVVYASSELPVYLSMNAAVTSGYGVAMFVQSLLVLLSFIVLAAAALLIFLSRATTARGEFTSTNQLIYSTIAVTAIALVFAAAALFPPASSVINPLHYLYVVMIAVVLAMAIYAIALLRDVVSYYTPRRK